MTTRTDERMTGAAPAYEPPRQGSRTLGFFLKLALPGPELVLGTAVFVLTLVPIAVSLGLMVTIVGIPLFLLAALAVRAMSSVERRRLRLYFGTEFLPRPPGPRGLTAHLADGATWRAIAYLLLRGLLGIVGSVVTVGVGAGALSFVSMPFWLRRLPAHRADLWLLKVTDLRTAWLMALVGVVVGAIAIGLAYAFGAAQSGLGRALLGPAHPASQTPTPHPTGGRLLALLIGLPLGLAAAGWTAIPWVGTLERSTAHHGSEVAWKGGEITVTLDAGDIRIVPGAADTVSVDVTEHYEFRVPTFSATTTAGGGVLITGRCAGWFYLNDCSQNHVLTVPPRAHLVLRTGDGAVTVTGVNGGLSVHTNDGDIRLTDLTGALDVSTNAGRVDVARSKGDLRAHTGDGNITLREWTGALDVSTNAGPVRGSGLRSATVTARTHDGPVDLQFPVEPTRVVATTGDGPVRLTVPPGTGPYQVDATTGDGGTEVDVPTASTSTRSLTAHSGDGSVTLAVG